MPLGRRAKGDLAMHGCSSRGGGVVGAEELAPVLALQQEAPSSLSWSLLVLLQKWMGPDTLMDNPLGNHKVRAWGIAAAEVPWVACRACGRHIRMRTPMLPPAPPCLMPFQADQLPPWTGAIGWQLNLNCP